MNILSGILKKDIKKSRQHYLKLKFPSTYENLIELDVYHDYSMGYPSQVGFRASTAASFYFYDLSLEIKTRLKVFPFAVMDVTLRSYLNLDLEQSKQLVFELIEEVKAVDGLFISLFHNHTFSNFQGWEGWQDFYVEMIEKAL